VGGEWTEEEAGAISVEEGIAKTLNLKLGDSLRFDIGGVQTRSQDHARYARWTGAPCAPTSL